MNLLLYMLVKIKQLQCRAACQECWLLTNGDVSRRLYAGILRLCHVGKYA